MVLRRLMHRPGPQPPPTRPVELGISDSDAPTVGEHWWDGLGISRARVVVPYDVATTRGIAGDRRRRNFDAYRDNAAAKGVELLVVMAPSADVRPAAAPSADAYATAFAAFLERYPGVGAIAPWNEPNNRDARHYPLGSDPHLAAEYWLRADALLRERERTTTAARPLLLAGSFAGIPGDDAYVDAYQRALARAGARPEAWAFHAHGDVNAFQEHGQTRARATRYQLGKLRGDVRIWIDEIGARYRDARGAIWGDDSQARATEFLLSLASLDSRIEAIYYYNYSNQCAEPRRCAVQDRGLVSPRPFNGEPPDYDEADRRRAAYEVIAGRAR